MRPAIDLAVVVPDLCRGGGAERLAIACIERWRERFRTTVYSTGFPEGLAERLGPAIALRPLSPATPVRHGTPEQTDARLVDGLLLPALWGEEMGTHDVYLAHQWPTQRIRRRPLVWYAHEPRRVLHDLRYEMDSDDLAAWTARVRKRAGAQWGRVVDSRFRAVQALLDEAELRDRPDRVVANSRFTADALQRILGGPPPDVVRPGVELAAFAPPEFEEPFFLAIGSLLRHKQPRLLLEALALAPDARLVLVGRGALAEACGRMAEALDVADRVTLRGEVSDHELRDLLRRCRGVVFFPIAEPFGMVALEALAAGKPLIASGDGGYAEVVDETCALLVPPEPARIAEALEALLDDPERARTLGAAGRAIAREHPWDATAKALGDILEETARGAAPSPRSQGVPEPAGPKVAVSFELGFGYGAASRGWGAVRAAGRRDAPAAGYYDSLHGSTIEGQHARLETLAPDLVLLVVPVEASGPGFAELAAAVHHFEIAERDGARLRFAIQARVAPGGEGRLAELVGLVAGDFARRAAQARVGDTPRLFVELGTGVDAARVAAALAVETAVAATVLSAEADEDVLRVPAGPGEAPWKDARVRMRNATAADWVLIDSWNDWLGDLRLEPSRLEGHRRLDLAAEFAREVRRLRWPTGGDRTGRPGTPCS